MVIAQIDSTDTLIFINPKLTYLRLSNESGTLNTIAINLYDLDHINLPQNGDYDNGPVGNTFEINMI